MLFNTESRDFLKTYVAVQIILTPDILESVLNAKDMENKNLRRQLQNVESKLMICTYENNIGRNTLQLQLEEKCKQVQQLEDKLTCLEKVSTLKYVF